MIVSDVLRAKGRHVVSAHADTSLAGLLKLMVDAGVGSVIVAGADSVLKGIVTERSIVEAVAKKGPAAFTQAARAFMQSPIPTCRPDDTVRHAMQSMTNARTRHLLVRAGGEALGIVSIGDLVKFRIRDAELENSVLRDIASARMLHS